MVFGGDYKNENIICNILIPDILRNCIHKMDQSVYFYMKCIRCPIYVQVPKRSLPVLCDECYKYLKNPLMNTDPKEIWTTYYVPRYIEN